MAITNEALLEALNSVVSIPLIPYTDGQIDYDGMKKNIAYLMNNNHLSDGRPRVISLAGTSLIHHVKPDDQVKLLDMTGQQMGSDGVLMAAVVPNPIGVTGDILDSMAKLNRPPDVCLIMPLGGTYSPEGLYKGLMEFGEKYGSEHGMRFLYYYRRPRDRDVIMKLIKDSPHFVGVKIGTNADDVTPFIENLGDDKITIWGIGDRSTTAAKKGSKGHTSGINVVVARASDEINNAQRAGDFEEALRVEAAIAPLEQLRFMNERAYNYSAVMEAINLAGFDDVSAGDGGPFNPGVSDEVRSKLEAIIPTISEYH